MKHGSITNKKAIYNQVYNQYPNSTIWLTGHSLGGAVASLVGITFGIPTVTFEIPGDKLAAARLHLPHPPGARSPIWHFGHTADPIFVGVCTVSFRLILIKRTTKLTFNFITGSSK